MNFDLLPWKEYITLAVASLGAGLGIINTWNGLNQRRVKLRVGPAHAIPVPEGPPMFCIEVVNLSTFPVTVIDVGFSMPGKRRLAVLAPEFADRGSLPRRLDSRQAITAYFSLSDISGKPIKKAYARTACGETAYGDSPALRQVRRGI